MANEMIKGMGFHHIGLKVADFAKSRAMYNALGMKEVCGWGEGEKEITAGLLHQMQVVRRHVQLMVVEGGRTRIIVKSIGVIEPAVFAEDNILLGGGCQQCSRNAVVGGYHFLTEEKAAFEIFAEFGKIIGIKAAVPLGYGRFCRKALVCARFGRAEDEKSHRGYDADDKKHRDEQD